MLSPELGEDPQGSVSLHSEDGCVCDIALKP